MTVLLTSCSSNSRVDEVNLDTIYPSSELIISTHSDWTRTHYPKRIKEFKNNPLQNGDVVFLGNSITEQAESWADKTGNAKAKNRGIAGDTTEGVLARLGELNYFKPSKLFILIGINDLFHSDISAETTFQNIIKIIDEIASKNKNTKIYVNTILPTTDEALIKKINKTNTHLEESAGEKPFELIKINQNFALPDGKMNMDFSTDGVHLNKKGYTLWINTLKQYI